MMARLEPNPTGLCMCGCGARTNVAKQAGGGYRAGEHYRYVIGHQHRKNPRLVQVDPDTGCWVWLGGAGADSRGTGHRYGIMRVSGRCVRAHRYYYEQANGPIPRGLVLDHLCRNTLCVNPDHLEAVTQAENIRRGLDCRADRALLEHPSLPFRPRRSKCDPDRVVV